VIGDSTTGSNHHSPITDHRSQIIGGERRQKIPDPQSGFQLQLVLVDLNRIPPA